MGVHVLLDLSDLGGQGVDARIKSSPWAEDQRGNPTHGCPVQGNRLSLTIRTQPKIPLAGLDPAIHVFLGFGDLAAKAWMPGSSPGKGYLQLHCASRHSILHCCNC